ncbi:MAG: NifU family protein [Bacteroidia bacterium]
MFIYTEATPNPQSVKFVIEHASHPLTHGISMQYETPSAEAPALIQALWQIPDIERIFLAPTFVTITKKENADWYALIPTIKDILQKYFPDAPLGTPATETPTSEIEKQILDLLDTYIRPAIAMDGGDVTLEKYESGTVYLRLKGSCMGCPSSLYTLKMGIENLLRQMLPHVEKVEALP